MQMNKKPHGVSIKRTIKYEESGNFLPKIVARPSLGLCAGAEAEISHFVLRVNDLKLSPGYKLLSNSLASHCGKVTRQSEGPAMNFLWERNSPAVHPAPARAWQSHGSSGL